MWFAGQAICLSSLFVTSQAGAVRQVPFGPTSTGSINITVSILAPARASGPDVIHFRAPESLRSKILERLCLSRNTAARDFSVSAIGSGKAGALVLSDGYRNVPYDVHFVSEESPAPEGDRRTRDDSDGDCGHGQRAIAVAIALDPKDVDEIQTNTGLAGILTLIIAPG